MMFVKKLMHREQFHCGHPQAVEIIQQRGMGEPGIGAAPLRGDRGMAGRQPFTWT
jgi:hypothetical protein